jgi:hypothetical protein
MSDSKKLPNTAINESDDHMIGSMSERSMIEEDDAGFDIHREMDRRMTQLMDVDHVFKPSSKSKTGNKQGTFKRVNLPGMTEVETAEEAFNLEPVKLPKKEEQFSFGKIDHKKGQSHSRSNLIAEGQLEDANTSANGKVTIPIDWDSIIDKYIKNTNTNLFEANKATEGKDEDRDSDEDF